MLDLDVVVSFGSYASVIPGPASVAHPDVWS